MKVDINKIATANFKAKPELKKQYIFPDGAVFYYKQQADDYKTVIKEDYQTIKRPSEDNNDGGGGKPAYTQEQIEAAQADLKVLELKEDADWDTIQRIGKTLGVSAKSKADYIEKLKPIKEELLK